MKMQSPWIGDTLLHIYLDTDKTTIPSVFSHIFVFYSLITAVKGFGRLYHPFIDHIHPFRMLAESAISSTNCYPVEVFKMNKATDNRSYQHSSHCRVFEKGKIWNFIFRL
jgi:hypothetical protein